MCDQIDIKQFLFCSGFPGTGKTTFLAALWHVINSGEVHSALELQTLYEGDREYLNARTQEWLEFRKVKRTLQDHPDPILLTLRRRTDGALLRINVPDMSGETFRVLFEDRWCTKAFDERAGAVSGLLFFVHAGQVKDPTKISAAAAAVEAWQDSDTDKQDKMPPATEGPAAPKELPGFTIQECCTQAKCVDLLQLLLERIPTRPLRVAVVVSAFDELEQTPFRDQPREFLQKRLALLEQYLRAAEGIEWTVYGLSAQGGHYDGGGIVEKLAEKGVQRIRVWGHSGLDSDITRPFRWLAFGVE